MRISAAVAVVLMVFVAAAFAETGGTADNNKVKKHYIYEWTDTKGGVHITDDLGDVPPPYREKARKIEMPKGSAAGPGQQQVQGGTELPSEAATEAQKAVWQQRLQEWKQRLADAQERYSNLEQRRQEALEKWGGSPASGHREGRVEAERMEQEMKGVQRDIDKAKNMIETVIPEEARRAGIPPGWLRE